MASIYDFTAKAADGSLVPLAAYRGKAMLIVNTASQCGFTPQYGGLEAIHRCYQDAGLIVLGFPCNQFGGQEPGDAEQIRNFCAMTYDVTFPVLAKIDVKGPTADPLYEYLTHERPGLMGSVAVKWNFTKFLIGRDGAVLKRFAPTAKPQSMHAWIRRALAS